MMTGISVSKSFISSIPSYPLSIKRLLTLSKRSLSRVYSSVIFLIESLFFSNSVIVLDPTSSSKVSTTFLPEAILASFLSSYIFKRAISGSSPSSVNHDI